MTNSSTFLLSNLASGIFIDLTVPADEDALQAAREHLRQTQLPPEVQHGFFLSVYAMDAPADNDDQRPSAAPPLPAPKDAAAAPDELSPLDKAAAQGPLDWTQANSPAETTAEPDTAAPAALTSLVTPPLGSAGGH